MSETAIFGPILTGFSFFAAENRFNMRMFPYKLPVIDKINAVKDADSRN